MLKIVGWGMAVAMLVSFAPASETPWKRSAKEAMAQAREQGKPCVLILRSDEHC